MKVSALIPTYNRRDYIFRAIDSVLAQTVPVDEIIVVDDGSTDGTADAIRKVYGTRVALVIQENSGVSAARNRSLREARGDWVAFLDSDDFWFPTKIESQLQALTSLGEEFGLCFTDCVYEGNPELNLSVFEENGRFQPGHKYAEFQDPTRSLFTGSWPVILPSILVRRSLFEGFAGFDETLQLGEDVDVILRLSFKTRFCFIAEPLVRIDRTASRDGLFDLIGSRDDRKYDNSQRRLINWLALPNIAGSEYEVPIRNGLREVYYNSVESKLHDFRIRPALGEIRRLTNLGNSYPSVFATLLSRRMAKLFRNPRLEKT